MKNELDSLETDYNKLYRFVSDLSQRTQETNPLEDLQQLQIFVQRLKIQLKDLLCQVADNQTKYSSYTQQVNTYNQSIDHFQVLLQQIIITIDEWKENNPTISIEIVQNTLNSLQGLLHNQATIQRQAHLLHELTETLVDSTINPDAFR